MAGSSHGGYMRKKLLILFITLLCLTGCSKASSEVVLKEVEDLESAVEASDSREAGASYCASAEACEDASLQGIVVYVCGAVKAPGVYELPPDSRINDAVIAAGGFDSPADTDYVNLAAALSDGMKLYIPTLEETADSSTGGASEILSYDTVSHSGDGQTEAGSSLININTASREQLMTLPGIGEKVADRIIEYRDKNGRFSQKEDIMKISGIKEKLFSKISDKITV